MKKLFLFTAIMAFFASASFASNAYKIDDEKVDALFSQSDDVTMSASTEAIANFSTTSTLAEQTVGGYLVRAFFCGAFALHRSYMGTGGKTLWYYYLCIPVAGGVVGCVDFWWVVFKGQDALSKYKDNPEWVVWN